MPPAHPASLVPPNDCLPRHDVRQGVGERAAGAPQPQPGGDGGHDPLRRLPAREGPPRDPRGALARDDADPGPPRGGRRPAAGPSVGHRHLPDDLRGGAQRHGLRELLPQPGLFPLERLHARLRGLRPEGGHAPADGAQRARRAGAAARVGALGLAPGGEDLGALGLCVLQGPDRERPEAGVRPPRRVHALHRRVPDRQRGSGGSSRGRRRCPAQRGGRELRVPPVDHGARAGRRWHGARAGRAGGLPVEQRRPQLCGAQHRAGLGAAAGGRLLPDGHAAPRPQGPPGGLGGFGAAAGRRRRRPGVREGGHPHYHQAGGGHLPVDATPRQPVCRGVER
mmetsp:Transcript_79422/g.236628  ORF Transcript_79422/g.236628 Transcript_79422/m.236628 type:complete len:338 (-) Transcript_79422:255-1268(-)